MQGEEKKQVNKLPTEDFVEQNKLEFFKALAFIRAMNLDFTQDSEISEFKVTQAEKTLVLTLMYRKLQGDPNNNMYNYMN